MRFWLVINPLLASELPIRIDFFIKNNLSQESDSFLIGEKIILEMQIMNETDKDIIIQQSGPGFDFVVKQGARTVWSSHYGQVFAQVITAQTINPSGALNFSASWPGHDNAGRPCPVGRYDVVPQAGLFFEGKRVVAPKSKTIVLNKK